MANTAPTTTTLLSAIDASLRDGMRTMRADLQSIIRDEIAVVMRDPRIVVVGSPQIEATPAAAEEQPPAVGCCRKNAWVILVTLFCLLCAAIVAANTWDLWSLLEYTKQLDLRALVMDQLASFLGSSFTLVIMVGMALINKRLSSTAANFNAFVRRLAPQTPQVVTAV